MKRSDLKAALENQNVRAFLKGIRLGEGTSDEAGYYRIVGGGTFSDASTHPHVSVWIEKYGVKSSAAGAFQIIFPTYVGLCNQYGFTDFEPETQDEMAVALIAEKHALYDVIAGELEDAIRKCSPIWASLPGSKAGQRQEQYEAIEKVYLDNGGTIV